MRVLLIFFSQLFIWYGCFAQSTIVKDIFNSSHTKTAVEFNNEKFDLIEYKISDVNHVRYGLTVCFIKIPLIKVKLRLRMFGNSTLCIGYSNRTVTVKTL
jgi:hypothetical protein